MRDFRIMLLLPLIAACSGPATAVQCEQDSNCNLSAGGSCVASSSSHNWCAYPDPACPGGYRYSEQSVGDGLAGECVADDGVDGGVDAPSGDGPNPVTCDRSTAFAAPTPVSGLATSEFEGMARFSPDELTVYFSAQRAPAASRELYTAQRSSIAQGFGAATAITALNSAAGEYDPSPSGDGLTIVFTSDRVAGEGLHLFVASRSSTLGDFGSPTLLVNVNSAAVADQDRQGFLTANAQAVWVLSNRASGVGGDDLWRAARSGGGFGIPAVVTELSSTSSDWAATPSSDELLIYFASNRPGTAGGFDVWTSFRGTPGETWSPPARVAEVSTASDEFPVWLSPDKCRLYLNRGGDVLVATRSPL